MGAGKVDPSSGDVLRFLLLQNTLEIPRMADASEDNHSSGTVPAPQKKTIPVRCPAQGLVRPCVVEYNNTPSFCWCKGKKPGTEMLADMLAEPVLEANTS